MSQHATTPPVVVVGASAGGVEALRTLVADLPADFPACMSVTLHVPSSAPAEHAREGSPIETGRILIAPPDHHLILLGGRLDALHHAVGGDDADQERGVPVAGHTRRIENGAAGRSIGLAVSATGSSGRSRLRRYRGPGASSRRTPSPAPIGRRHRGREQARRR